MLPGVHARFVRWRLFLPRILGDAPLPRIGSTIHVSRRFDWTTMW
jgi:hypothetical protein